MVFFLLGKNERKREREMGTHTGAVVAERADS